MSTGDRSEPVGEEKREEEAPQQPLQTQKLNGLVVAKGRDGFVAILCGSVPMLARVPPSPPEPIVPGCWVNFDMNLETGKNQIVGECKPKYRTYIFDDGTFSVLSPATYYLEPDMNEDDHCLAYTPFFRFVEDPKRILQTIDWMEWYKVLLGPCTTGKYLLQVERIVSDMAGCIEPGALPGQMPTGEQIAAIMKKDEPIGDYEGVKRVVSRQLGLCIGPIYYERREDEDSAGGNSASGSRKGTGGTDHYNRLSGRVERGGGGGGRGRWNHGGRGGGWGGGARWNEERGRGDGGWSKGGREGGWAADLDWRSQNRGTSYGGESSSSYVRSPNRQYQRGDDISNKKVKGSLIFTHRGMVFQKPEKENYVEGEWLAFDKTAKSEMTLDREDNDKEAYPAYILQHEKLEKGYNGETRVMGTAEEWNIQVKVQVEFGLLRQNQWIEPSFFGIISCQDEMVDKARNRLEREKMGWAEMSEKKQNEVSIHVWIGMSIQKRVKLPGLEMGYPKKVKWTVRDLADSDFIRDMAFDTAIAAFGHLNV